MAQIDQFTNSPSGSLWFFLPREHHVRAPILYIEFNHCPKEGSVLLLDWTVAAPDLSCPIIKLGQTKKVKVGEDSIRYDMLDPTGCAIFHKVMATTISKGTRVVWIDEVTIKSLKSPRKKKKKKNEQFSGQ